MKNKKVLFIIIGILLVACIVVVAVVLSTRKDDSYRIVKVYEFEGELISFIESLNCKKVSCNYEFNLVDVN